MLVPPPGLVPPPRENAGSATVLFIILRTLGLYCGAKFFQHNTASDKCRFFRWRRPNGFILAGILIVLGLGSLIFGAIHQRSRYDETKDYEEGTCKNVNKVKL